VYCFSQSLQPPVTLSPSRESIFIGTLFSESTIYVLSIWWETKLEIPVRLEIFTANECYKILSGDQPVNAELKTNVSETESVSIIRVNRDRASLRNAGF
jgi:hypothetical protein